MATPLLGITAVMLPELDFARQIALCRSLDIKYYQYRPRPIADAARNEPFNNPWGNHRFDLTPQRLLAEGRLLTRQLRDGGMEPWGTLPAITLDADEDLIKLHCEAAAEADAASVRCGPPPYPQTPFDYGAFLDKVIKTYARVIERISGPLKIKLVMETHADSFATSPALAWNICRHFSPAQLSVIFDLSNFAREGEVKPNLAISVLRDYIDCIHVGGSRRVPAAIGRDTVGAKCLGIEACAMEESDLNIPRWLAALRDAGCDAPLIIEDFDKTLSGPERLARSAKFLRRAIAAM